jgi:hypothetical protein
MTQWLTFANGVSSPWALSNVNSGTRILYEEWGVLPDKRQLWQLTAEGLLVSAVDPSLALTVGAQATSFRWTLGLAPRLPAGTAQLWTVMADPDTPALAAIVNPGTGLACTTVPRNRLWSGQEIWLEERPPRIPEEMLWRIQPRIPATHQWLQLHFGTDPLIAEVAGPRAAATVALGVGTPPRSGKADRPRAAALWMYTDDGCLVNALAPGLVLGLGPSSPYGTSVVLAPKQPPDSTGQHWAIQPDGDGTVLLINASNQEAMMVPPGLSGPIVTGPISGSSQQSFTLGMAPAGGTDPA